MRSAVILHHCVVMQLFTLFLRQALDVAKDFKMIDIFILLMLHWMNHKKAVESLVRNKIRAGILTEALVNNVFTSYSQVCFFLYI